MKKTGLLLAFVFMTISWAVAQPHHDNKSRQRIKALKIAFITEKLDLEPKQAERFWPVYNNYEKEKWEQHKSFYDKYRDENPTADRKTAHDYIKANLDYQEAELALKKKYKDKLLKVISAEQLAELYQAERGFKEMLIRELGRRHGGGPENRERPQQR